MQLGVGSADRHPASGRSRLAEIEARLPGHLRRFRSTMISGGRRYRQTSDSLALSADPSGRRASSAHRCARVSAGLPGEARQRAFVLRRLERAPTLPAAQSSRRQRGARHEKNHSG